MGGKFSTTPAGTEKEISRIAGVTSGVIKYTMAYVDSRDLTVELNAQEKTSSTTIPVRAVFNKLINTASVTTDDFVIFGDASVANLACANETDSDNALRTVCTLELEINEVANATNLTVDLPAGVVQDKTRGAAK